MNNESQVKRLILWNRLWITLWFLVFMIAIGAKIIGNVRADISQLHLHWQEDGSVKLSAMKDGPFLVTHLVNYQAGKVIATLPQPIAIIDSGGEIISADTMKKLVWRQCVSGEKTQPPPKDSIVALYLQAETAKRYVYLSP